MNLRKWIAIDWSFVQRLPYTHAKARRLSEKRKILDLINKNDSGLCFIAHLNLVSITTPLFFVVVVVAVFHCCFFIVGFFGQLG